jgi:hypothetical protein
MDVENHEQIKNVTSNWKMIIIITAFVNRNILIKADLDTNVKIEDKKPVLLQKAAEPIILNVSYIDTYNVNLFKEIHQSLDIDLQYLRSNPKSQPIPNDYKLLKGLTTLNEHINNFISYSYDNLYDQKFKKIIEYFLQQREYYLSIGKVKLSA